MPTSSILCINPVQSPKEADARALLKLLSPTGVLFTAMYSADADGATQFFFPKERLPTHTQVGRRGGRQGAAGAAAGAARQAAVACSACSCTVWMQVQ